MKSSASSRTSANASRSRKPSISRLIGHGRRRKKSRALRPTQTAAVPSALAAQELEGPAQDVRVEGAGEPLVGGDDDESLRGPSRRTSSGCASSPSAPDQGAEQLRHLVGVGPRREDALLGAPQLRRGDELHRAGDLLRRLDGADPPPDVPERRHRVGPCPSLRRGLDAPGGHELGLRARDQLVELRRGARRSAPSCRGSRPGSAAPRLSAYWWSTSSNARTRVDRHVVEQPWVPAKMMATCFSTASGGYWPCFRSSTMRWPRASCSWVALSRSEPNWANAASSRYCARSSRSLPGDLAHGLDLGGAAHARDREADVHGRPDAARRRGRTRGRSGRR